MARKTRCIGQAKHSAALRVREERGDKATLRKETKVEVRTQVKPAGTACDGNASDKPRTRWNEWPKTHFTKTKLILDSVIVISLHGSRLVLLLHRFGWLRCLGRGA